VAQQQGGSQRDERPGEDARVVRNQEVDCDVDETRGTRSQAFDEGLACGAGQGPAPSRPALSLGIALAQRGRFLGVVTAVVSLWLVFAMARLLLSTGLRNTGLRNTGLRNTSLWFLTAAAVSGMFSQVATTASPDGAISRGVLLSGGLGTHRRL
jgi:hypothetical protein